jgi:hypothetical protein
MQQKQLVDHKQSADSCEQNNEECQLTLHCWTELSTVPNSTFLRNYCSYSKWTTGASSHWSNFPQGTTGLAQYSQRRHLWTNQISACVDTMKIRSLDSILQVHELGIQKSTKYYSYFYIIIPSFIIILFTIISCYGKPYWITEIIRILPGTKELIDPKSPEIIPRANPWMNAK